LAGWCRSPAFTTAERLALAGFLAGYTGLTRQAYELDLRQYASWCALHNLHLFGARRPDIGCFASDLEARGRSRATVTRRLCTIAGFYKYAVEEELLDHSPAAHVRRPRCRRIRPDHPTRRRKPGTHSRRPRRVPPHRRQFTTAIRRFPSSYPWRRCHAGMMEQLQYDYPP
jgi:hypothetical protein